MKISELISKASKSISKEDATYLARYVFELDYSGIFMHSNEEVSTEKMEEFLSLADQRKAGKPIAYITRERGFYRHVFYSPQKVLIPQPDTETLVEEAVSFIKTSDEKNEFSILDLCAGTGCIGISVSFEAYELGKKTNLVLSDISEDALEAFSINCEKILKNTTVKVEKMLGDLFSCVEGRQFDMIVSNPPYIASSVISSLPPDVQAEPHLALDGGIDGLDLIRKISNEAWGFLNKNGILLVEIGYDQGEISKKLFLDAGFSSVEIIKDLGQRDRVVKCLK